MIQIGLIDYAPLDKIIEIRDKDQIIKAKYVIDSKDIHKHDLMGDHYIEISFKLDSFENFNRTDYILWEGTKFTLRNNYIPTQENNQNYNYTLKFEAPEMLLQDAEMFYLRQDLKEGEWSLTSNAASFIKIAVNNANRYFNTTDWKVGTIEPLTTEFITFNSTNVFEALTQIAETFKAEWNITGNTIHLVNKHQIGSEIEFENELSVASMSQSQGDAVSGYTRIVALGSTRNIPANYRPTTQGEGVDAIYQKRLRIPISKGSVIDAKPNLSALEAVETTVIFEEVYPKRIGTLSGITTKEYTDTDETTKAVTKWNAYRYKDTGLSFKESYLLPGVELRLVFQSGKLNGMDFAVKFNPDGKAETDPLSQVFEIIRSEDYGVALPNETLKPQNGDQYILYGFNIDLVASQYVPAAELELYNKGVAWIAENLKDKSVYECPTIINHFANKEMDLTIGQKVKLVKSLGGLRNYIRSSKELIQPASTNGYNLKILSLSEPIQSNTQYTLSIGKTEITSGTAVTSFTVLVYNLSTNSQGASLISFPISADRKSVTFTTGNLPNNGYTILMYTGGSGNAQNRAMKWTEVKLEKSNQPSVWSLAPEDAGTIRSSRIMGFEKKLINKYDATYTVGDNSAYSRLSSIQKEIDELKYAGQIYQNTAGNGVYLIKQFDNTPPSDFNVYSAVASNSRYLNRQTGGTVQGNTTFQQDVSIQGKAISDQFGNSTFTSGQFGSGFKMWKAANGQSYAELDNLLVRREMIVNVLTIAEIRSVGGQILVSVANMTASAVSDGGIYWKVSFDTADGTIPNYFAVDDQVICRRWTGTNILYYWAKVTSIGTDYINVSKTDKDGSGIPSIGDEIIQFGNRTNTARQSAIIISAYGSDAPSIKQYSGINSYDLTGKEVTVISPLGNKFTGNFIIQNTGKSISETIDAIQIGGRNFLQQSRLDSIAGWSFAGGTPSVYADPNFGNVIRWERTSGSGGFQKGFAINKAELSNTDVVYYVIARRSTGSFQFGGWTETTGYLHSDTANKIDLGNGWVQYWRTFRSGADIASGTTFGINTVTGAWLFFAAGVLKGNKPLDWTIAPEDTQSLINTAQSTANNAILQVSEAKSSITVLNNQIASKVEQTDFNSLKGRVSDAESSIIQNANNITSTVTKVEAKNSTYRSLTSSNTDRPKVPYSKDDMWITYEGAIRQSTTTRLSGLFIDSDWVLSTKYIDESAITAIEIGGRNYIRNSIKISKAATTNPFNFEVLALSENLVPNTQYILSIGKTEITSGTAVPSFTVIAYNMTTGAGGGVNIVFPVSADRKSVTFTTGLLPNNGYTLLLYTGIGGASENRSMTWEKVQLEKANKAMSWNAAPEDIDVLIGNAQNTADTKNRLYYQDLQPTTPSGGFREGDMWYKASLVDFDGNINANVAVNKYQLQQRWNGSTWVKVNWSASRSWVKQTDDQIISVVEKTGINGLGAGETLKSLIDQTPSKIEFAVSSIQIGGRNFLQQSRLDSIAGWSFAGGTPSVYADPNFGNVIRWERTSGSGGFQKGFAINKAELSNTDVVYYVIARRSTGSFQFGGWTETTGYLHSDTANKIDLGNGWVQYWRTFRSGADIASGTTFGINTVTGAWLFFAAGVLKGNKPLDWTIAPEDTQALINTAQSTANNAATTATTAQSTANTANSLLSDIANDNKLDPSEKQSTLKEWNIIQSEYTRNIAQASSFTVSSAAYTTAYNSLSSYITPLLSNMNITSDIVGTTFRATFKAYYDARTDLLNAIATKAKTLANTAQTTADSKTTADEVKSSFTVTDNKISLLSKTIELKGTTIAKAIQAEELNVGKFRVATDGKIYATDGEFSGKISATSGSIAGFSISEGKIGSEFNQNGLGLFSSSIKFVGSNVLAAIGENVLPGSSALNAVGRFENNIPNSLSVNRGLVVTTTGGAENRAIDMLGGCIAGLTVKARRVTTNTTLTHADVYVSVAGSGTITLTLPSSPETGKVFFIRKVSTSLNLNLDGNGNSIVLVINGSVSTSIGSGINAPNITLVYDGYGWYG